MQKNLFRPLLTIHSSTLLPLPSAMYPSRMSLLRLPARLLRHSAARNLKSLTRCPQDINASRTMQTRWWTRLLLLPTLLSIQSTTGRIMLRISHWPTLTWTTMSEVVNYVNTFILDNVHHFLHLIRTWYLPHSQNLISLTSVGYREAVQSTLTPCTASWANEASSFTSSSSVLSWSKLVSFRLKPRQLSLVGDTEATTLGHGHWQTKKLCKTHKYHAQLLRRCFFTQLSLINHYLILRKTIKMVYPVVYNPDNFQMSPQDF